MIGRGYCSGSEDWGVLALLTCEGPGRNFSGGSTEKWHGVVCRGGSCAGAKENRKEVVSFARRKKTLSNVFGSEEF